MAKQGSKGLTKRHSEQQKARYKAHYFKLADNKVARLRRHVRRNESEVRRKGQRKPARIIKIDQQAVRHLHELTNTKSTGPGAPSSR